jgi:hypothetical protein
MNMKKHMSIYFSYPWIGKRNEVFIRWRQLLGKKGVNY